MLLLDLLVLRVVQPLRTLLFNTVDLLFAEKFRLQGILCHQ
jgi:hypothetical protein